MSHALTEVDSYTPTITVPDGTDSRDHAAEDVQAIAQGLANRTLNHKNRLDALVADFADAARKSASNTFTQPNTFQNVNANDIAAHDVHASHNINADNWVGSLDITATRDIDCGRNYTYLPMPTRTVQINLNGLGAFEGTFGSYIVLNGVSYELVNIPIRMPHGAQLGVCRVKIGGAGTYLMYARRKHGINMANNTTPTLQDVDTKTGTAGAVENIVLNFGNLTTSKDELYWLSIQNNSGVSSLMNIYAVEATFVDPGPRNH